MYILALFLPAFAQDTTAPFNGSVEINGGALYTNRSTVSVEAGAEDDTAVTEMCLSNTSTCSAWLAYAGTASWSIGTTQGTRTVYMRFRDGAGNTSDLVTDSIVYDSIAPTGGAVTSATGTVSGQVDLSWSGFTETNSGIESYQVVYQTGSAPASKCTNGTTAYDGADTSASLTGLTDGTTYYVRVCATDRAGNTSTGATATVVPKAETNAPTGTVIINSGATYTTTSAVTLSLSATDDTGVTSMCVSNSTTCTNFQTYTTTKTWTMSGNGDKTVYVYFKDASANVSMVATDQIIVDTVKPTNPTLSAAVSDQTIDLSWTTATDATSGVAYYKVVRHTSAVSSCSAGTLIYTGTNTTYTDTGLSNGTTYYYRVCAVDNAGLVGAGGTTTAVPASELEPPVNGVVTINSGGAWTNTTAVTLTLSAEDASGVAKMCISNSTTCTSYQTFAATKSWSLSGSGTTRTVRVWFQDSNGNKTSSAVSDSINLDTTKPTNGTASASPGAVHVALAWTGFADTVSGIASYKVVYARSATAPSSCSVGTTGYTGADTSATISGLSQGSTYSFRVCATDAAGNTSVGATVLTTTITDTTPPTDGVVTATASEGAASLTWTPASDAESGVASYTIAYNDDGTAPTACTSADTATATTATALTITGLAAIPYTFRVCATDQAGNTSSGATVTLSPCTTELCDGMDNDCDGEIDDPACEIAGEWVAVGIGDCTAHDLFSVSGSDQPDDTHCSAFTEGLAVVCWDGASLINPITPEMNPGCAYKDLPVESCVDGDAPGAMYVCVIGTTWYADTDGDGYGDLNGSVTAVEQPAGYVSDASDCNDADSGASPAGVEVCDEVDNDCDGMVDEGFDADSDGTPDCQEVGMWVYAGVSDCSAHDTVSESGTSTPNDALCSAANEGLAVVCWDGVSYSNGVTPSMNPGCAYKDLPAASCVGGQWPGYLYVCVVE